MRQPRAAAKPHNTKSRRIETPSTRHKKKDTRNPQIYSSPSIAWDGWIEGDAAGAFAESSIRVTSSLQTSFTAAFLASNEPSGAPKIDSAARRTFFWVALPSSWAMA